MAAPTLNPGGVVGGKYAVVERLGFGGVTATYRVTTDATSPSGDAQSREWALKVIDPAVGSRPEVMAALRRAAEATNRLPVDAVAHVIDSGFDVAARAPFSVTTFLDRRALDRLIADHAFGSEDVTRMLRGIAAATDEAHRIDRVHLGLKPANVFLRNAQGEGAIVTDFGFAAARGAVRTTESRAVSTPWIAPEQRDAEGEGGAAADVFSAALVAFFALTRHSFWRACQLAQPDLNAWRKEILATRALASERAKELGTTLPSALDPVFARALSLEPGERFASVGDFGDAFAIAAQPPQHGTQILVTDPMEVRAAAAIAARLPPPPPAPPARGARPVVPPPPGLEGAESPAAESALSSSALPSPPKSRPPHPPPSHAPPPNAATNAAPNAQPHVPTNPEWTSASQAFFESPVKIEESTGSVPFAASTANAANAADSTGEIDLEPEPTDLVTRVKKMREENPRVLVVFGVLAAALLILFVGGMIAIVSRLRRPDKTAETASAKVRSKNDDSTTKAAASSATVAASSSASTDAIGAAPASASASTDLELADASVELTVKCVPDCDNLRIDGKAVTDLTAPVKLPPGKHVVVAGKYGYAFAIDKVDLQAGTPLEKSYTLKKAAPASTTKKKDCSKFFNTCK